MVENIRTIQGSSISNCWDSSAVKQELGKNIYISEDKVEQTTEQKDIWYNIRSRGKSFSSNKAAMMDKTQGDVPENQGNFGLDRTAEDKNHLFLSSGVNDSQWGNDQTAFWLEV